MCSAAQPFLIDRYNFDNGKRAAEKCAERIAAALSLAVRERGRAVLAVAFSKDAAPILEALSQISIAWSCISIVPVEECCVPLSSSQSRERALRACLLQNKAAAAHFVGLYIAARTAELAAFSASARVNRLARPFDCIILDMDKQGQTGGFFKGSSRLRAALDRDGRALILPNYVKSDGATHLAMTLPLLLEAPLLMLPLRGKEKLLALEEALHEGEAEDMPIRAVLRFIQQPLQVFWSPE